MRHLQWRTTLPPHIQCWCDTAAQNARVCEQRKFRKTDCSVCTPTLNIGARGLSYRCVCKAKCISKRDLFDFESFANLFPSTVKKRFRTCLSRSCAEVCVVCFVLGLCLLKTQTGPANPINPVIESFANLLPLTLKKVAYLSFEVLRGSVWFALFRVCVHSKHRLIPLIPLILNSIPLKKLTNPTNPTNLDS